MIDVDLPSWLSVFPKAEKYPQNRILIFGHGFHPGVLFVIYSKLDTIAGHSVNSQSLMHKW